MTAELVIKSYLADSEGGGPGVLVELDDVQHFVELGGLIIERRDGAVEVRLKGGGRIGLEPIAANAVRITRA